MGSKETRSSVGAQKGVDDKLECSSLVSSIVGKAVVSDSGKQSQQHVERH